MGVAQTGPQRQRREVVDVGHRGLLYTELLGWWFASDARLALLGCLVASQPSRGVESGAQKGDSLMTEGHWSRRDIAQRAVEGGFAA